MEKRIDELVVSMKDEMIEAISEIVKIKSVQSSPAPDAPFGEGPAAALRCALSIGERQGFRAKNLDNYAGHVEYGDSGRLFGVLGHVDVVPEGQGWSVEPYGGVVKDGYLWGRGVIDNKGPMIAAIFALKAVRESGLTPKNRVRLIFGTNEESGWGGIKYYLSREEIPEMSVTPDASFPMIFAEKGIVNYEITKKLGKSARGTEVLSLEGGEASNMVAANTRLVLAGDLTGVVQVLESFEPVNGAGFCWTEENGEIVVEFQGKSAHGSTPVKGIGTIAAAIDLLGRLNLANGELAEFVQKINEKIGYEIDGTSAGIAGKDVVSGELTLNEGVLKLDGETVKLVVNIRYPIFFNEDRMFSQITEALGGLVVEKKHHQLPLYVSPDSELIRMLRGIYEEMTGLDSTPFSIGGGTYARAVPNAVAFGALPVGAEETEHQPNERIKVEDLMLVARIYAQLLYEVLK